jgi:hypothetical protein
MKIPEHITFSYLLAQFGVSQQYGATGTALMIAAGLLPDLDGVTILGGWRCHNRYHRVVGHGLPVTLGGPLLLTLLGGLLLPTAALVPLWCWLQLSLLAHLVTDILFYGWPVRLFWPLSKVGVGIGWVAWNDLVPTLLLYAGTALTVACWPSTMLPAVTLLLLAAYVTLRAFHDPGWRGWEGWLSGGWVRRSPRFCRWLTGDFIP